MPRAIAHPSHGRSRFERAPKAIRTKSIYIDGKTGDMTEKCVTRGKRVISRRCKIAY